MGVRIDTIAGQVTAGATTAKTLTGVTMAAGDSLTVRNFSEAGWCKLESIFYQGTAKDQIRILSPDLHDNVTGITIASGEEPSVLMLPAGYGQPLVSGDTLILEAGAAVSTSSVVALGLYYNDPNGPVSRLHSWGDISGIISSIKGFEVDVTSSATIGNWADTALNTTDKQLHAHTDYAVLGYQTDTALVAVGLKGDATSNTRVCGPGAASTVDITGYFRYMSDQTGTPHIPVFNADNQGATYVSVLANTASVSAKVYLILAELSHTVTP